MNILLKDPQGILTDRQANYAKKRLSYSLARFEHCINSASMRFTSRANGKIIRCVIRINVEGTGILKVKRSGDSLVQVVNQAADAVEPNVAYHVDWSAWFNADTFATWMVAVSQPFQWLFGTDHDQMHTRNERIKINKINQLKDVIRDRKKALPSM